MLTVHCMTIDIIIYCQYHIPLISGAVMLLSCEERRQNSQASNRRRTEVQHKQQADTLMQDD